MVGFRANGNKGKMRQLYDGRIPCPVDRNRRIFLTSHNDFLFINFLDSAEIIVNEIGVLIEN